MKTGRLESLVCPPVLGPIVENFSTPPRENGDAGRVRNAFRLSGHSNEAGSKGGNLFGRGANTRKSGQGALRYATPI
jgi:hypothetical protein